jgi:hypothetical protein
MAGTWLEWGGDFRVSASGGLLLADGADLARQRIIRRLMTAVNGYVWHLDYGAGLPQRIGLPGVASAVQAIVAAQIALEAAVAPNPPPAVSVTEDKNNPGAFVIKINYTDGDDGEAVSLTFATAGGQLAQPPFTTWAT